MKRFLLSISAVVLMLGFDAHAAVQRSYKKTGAESAEVTITTDDDSSHQAAAYVDGLENQQYIDMMVADPRSQLAKLMKKIKNEQCDSDFPDCGDVVLTAYVTTGFARGGWMDAGAQYTFFVGFREAGTGHFFTTYYFAVISEDVVANVDDNDEYAGSFRKNLSLVKILAIP